MPETITATPRTTSLGFARSRARRGRLILATCADIGRLDLLLRAAARRLSGTHRLTLAEPVVTRTLPTGSGTVISPSQFGEHDRGGDIVLAWHQGARSYGYTADLIDCLGTGATVIAGAPAGIGADVVARALWPVVTIVHLEAGTDRLRSALGRSPRPAGSTPDCVPRTINGMVTIPDHADLPAAVRALCVALERVIPSPASADRSVPQPRENATSGARARLAVANHLAPGRGATPRLLPRSHATRRTNTDAA